MPRRDQSASVDPLAKDCPCFGVEWRNMAWMKQCIRSLGGWGLLTALGCSSGAGNASVHAPTTARAAGPPAQAALSRVARAAPSEPLAYRDALQPDRVFIENAERAIGQYCEFIARAGDAPEYARAVQRSREQIADLRDTLVFVREGTEQRLPQCAGRASDPLRGPSQAAQESQSSTFRQQ